MSKPQKHPMNYQTRQLLLNKVERASFVMDGGAQLLASFKGQVEQMTWQVNAGKALEPAEIDRMGKHFKHEAGVILNALSALHGAMKAAYPKGKILWLQEGPAPWDPPGTEKPVAYVDPEFEDEARAEGLLRDEEEQNKQPA